MEKFRAFVVEDSPVVLESLAGALEEEAGVRIVGSAPDEGTAMEWLNSRTDECDVVIVDIFLKSGSGLGVLKQMRSFAPPPLRVVLTNYATPDMKVRCRELGAEIVFDKSNEIDEMLAWFSGRHRHDSR
ncbi:MAG: response regulator [Pseudomonadota bacterium]|nr:response regulator [Pseudomonadota bacterium]